MTFQELIFNIHFNKFPVKFLLTSVPVKSSTARAKHLSLSIKLYADKDAKNKDAYWMERQLPVPPRFETITEANHVSAIRWVLRQVGEILHAKLRESLHYKGEQFFFPLSDEPLSPSKEGQDDASTGTPKPVPEK